MAITTVRPNGSSASAYTVTVAASAHAALNDDLDTTYIKRTSGTNTGSATIQFGTASITSSTIVKRVRLRTRCTTPNSTSRMTFTLGTKTLGFTYYASTYQRKGVKALDTYVGPWYSTVPGYGGSWNQSALDGLFIQVKDYATTSGDRGTVYELYVDVDIASEPSTTVATPTGTVTSTSRPEVTWTYSDSDGEPQTYYQLRVFNDDQYGAVGFNVETSTPLWDSGELAGDLTSAPITALLVDDSYRVYVRTAKTVSSAPYWSDWSYSAFTVNVAPPTAPTLTLNHIANEGRVTISALGAAPTGFDSQTFELERSVDEATWVLIRGGSALLPDTLGLVATSDYEAPRGVTVYYRARAVGVIANDVYVSAWGTTASVAVANDGKWWFKPIEEPSTSVSGVRVAPGFDEMIVEAVGVFRPFGRTAALVVSGGIQGYDGSYTVSTVGESEWADLESVITHLGVIYVETPLGTSKYVRFISRDWTYSGTVGNTLRQVKLGYVEASA